MTSSPYKKEFGQRLKGFRKDRSLTQKDLSNQLGIRYQQLNKYESGFNLPSIEMIILIARILDIGLETLLTGEQPEDRPVISTRLLERFRALDGFPQDDQDAVIKLIDGLVFKHRVEGNLANPYIIPA